MKEKVPNNMEDYIHVFAMVAMHAILSQTAHIDRKQLAKSAYLVAEEMVKVAGEYERD